MVYGRIAGYGRILRNGKTVNSRLMNITIALVGWLAWNFLLFMMEKDKYDDQEKDFPFTEYRKKNWDNWLASLFMVPILLYFGYKGLGLDVLGVVDVSHLKWTDAYYPASGFFTEFIITLIKRVKKAV